jgi:hypothetical protein
VADVVVEVDQLGVVAGLTRPLDGRLGEEGGVAVASRAGAEC